MCFVLHAKPDRLESHLLRGYAPELSTDEFVWNHFAIQRVNTRRCCCSTNRSGIATPRTCAIFSPVPHWRDPSFGPSLKPKLRSRQCDTMLLVHLVAIGAHLDLPAPLLGCACNRSAAVSRASNVPDSARQSYAKPKHPKRVTPTKCRCADGVK